jgi:hypothetical protein
MLTFNPERHEYYLNGALLPNVTRILSDLTDLSMVPPAALEIARQKGNAAHRMVELWAKNDLDTGTLPEWMEPVFDEWSKFVLQSGFKVVDSEKRVFHPQYRYAGTLDLYGEMNSGAAYIDIKRSFLGGNVIGLQLAAYQGADVYDHKDRRTAKRYALRLKEGEPYRLQEYSDPNDFSVFTACLIRHNWKGKQ